MQWDAESYDRDFGFVTEYGGDLLDLIDVEPPAAAIDIGCGTGAHAAVLAERGYDVLGVDLDVAMIAQPNGKFLIDWESMVGASDLPWLEFKKTRPTQPFLVRVFARPDDYFNYEFSDDKRWSAAHLTSPDGNFFIYGYCEKDSEVARTLASIFEQVRGRAALTLRIAYPEKAESDHCARIVGIVANRWLLVR